MAKLIDILARELKVWPDQYYQIYQDSGGSLHGTLSNDDLEDCAQEDLPFEPVSIAWDGSDAVVDRAEWQAAVDALNAPKVVEWGGVGLPPVGTVCQYQNSLGSWFMVEITAIAKKGICFIQPDRDGENYACKVSSKFRPVRTAEQVAAEEREKAIKEICIDAGSPEMTPGQLKGAEKLYMAGYRKQ